MTLKSGVVPTVGGAVHIAAPLALLLSLSACAALEEALNPAESQPVAVESDQPPAAEAPLPPAPKPRPARVARLPAAPAEKPPPGHALHSAPPEPAAPESAPAVEALPLPDIKLVGLSRGEAASLLGAPVEERDAAPAKIWKFTSGECVVDIYFYLDVKRNDFYALHYNVQDRNGATTGEAADRCLQRIYGENRK
jgi:hypothetical protein